jgi:hypothetical protein
MSTRFARARSNTQTPTGFANQQIVSPREQRRAKYDPMYKSLAASPRDIRDLITNLPQNHQMFD